MTDHAVVCRSLVKRFHTKKKMVEAVNGLDLDVRRGECFGLLGPNGAGKTTTVEIVEGLLEPTSGEVEVLGMRWGAGHDHQLRQRLGITLQETQLREKLSVFETITMFRSFYTEGMEPDEALELVALTEKSDSWISRLSGGQKQRVAVACALVGRPELVFLDEPTTGLDPQARRQLWDVVSDIKRAGNTIVLTTHYMDEAEKLCDRVAIVDHGKVIALGSPRELISRLGGEHVIEFGLLKNDERAIQASIFSGIEGVSDVVEETGRYLLTVSEPHRSIPALLDFLAKKRIELESLTTRHVNLEDVFVNLTGRHLRDE